MKITPNQFAWGFLIVLAGLIGWGGYALFKFFQHPADTIFSIENEVKLGEYFDEQVRSQHGEDAIIHNDFADSCIRVIHQRLSSGVGESLYHYNITLLKGNEPNAFAIPGGNVYVYSGLIQFCNTPEEVAAVMAHEMGHVEKRHTVNNLVKQLGVGALIAMVTDGSGGNMEQLSGKLLNNFFSRTDEAEADDFALALLERCGIRPAILGEVFQRMKHDHGDMEGVMNLLSTHPELEQRSAKASAYVVGSEFSENPIDLDWKRLQSVLSQ